MNGRILLVEDDEDLSALTAEGDRSSASASSCSRPAWAATTKPSATAWRREAS